MKVVEMFTLILDEKFGTCDIIMELENGDYIIQKQHPTMEGYSTRYNSIPKEEALELINSTK